MNSIIVTTASGISYSIFQNQNDKIVTITTSGSGSVVVYACNLRKDCAQKSFSVKNKNKNGNGHHNLTMNDEGTIDEDDSVPNPTEDEEKAIQRRFKRLSRKTKSKRKGEGEMDEMLA